MNETIGYKFVTPHLPSIPVDCRHLPPRAAVHHVAGELDGRYQVAAGGVVRAVHVLGGVVTLRKDLAKQRRLDPLAQTVTADTARGTCDLVERCAMADPHARGIGGSTTDKKGSRRSLLFTTAQRPPAWLKYAYSFVFSSKITYK